MIERMETAAASETAAYGRSARSQAGADWSARSAAASERNGKATVPIFIVRGAPLYDFARYRWRVSENAASVRRSPHVNLAPRRLDRKHR
jgi:hypothetical protein